MHAPCIVGVPVESEDACPMHRLHTGGVRGCMPHASFASNGPRYYDRPVLHARHADNSIGPRVPSPRSHVSWTRVSLTRGSRHRPGVTGALRYRTVGDSGSLPQ